MSPPVVVLGGGPAGAACCLALAAEGLTPHWVAPPMAEDGDRIGESLSPSANTILADLGQGDLLRSGAHRPAHVTFSCWGSGVLRERLAIQHPGEPGHVLDRARFDRDLAARAAARAETIPATVVAVAREDANGAPWRLALSNGDTLTHPIVVDCTGRRSVIGRGRTARHRVDRLMVAHAFLRQNTDEVEPTRATLIEAVRDGWWYAALLPDGRMALTYFSDPDLMPRAVTRDVTLWRTLLEDTRYLREWVDSAGFVLDAPPRRASTATIWREHVAGDGWLLAGDAAAAFDPLSSNGITSALWSGREAGRAALAMARGDHAPAARYARALREGVEDFLKQRQSVYASERRFQDAPFWARRTGPSTAP